MLDLTTASIALEPRGLEADSPTHPHANAMGHCQSHELQLGANAVGGTQC